MRKNLSDAYTETQTAFTVAQRREAEQAKRVERLRHDLGSARTVEVRMAAEMRHGMTGLDAGPEVSAEMLRALSSQKQALADQRLLVDVLIQALECAETALRAASEQVATAWRAFHAQAGIEFRSSWGKTASRFMFWGDADEQSRSWRSATMHQLCALIQQGKPGAMEMLSLLLRGEDFRVIVRRGFRISTDEGMRDVTPGGECAVPKDLPLRDAFEAVVANRAELVAA